MPSQHSVSKKSLNIQYFTANFLVVDIATANSLFHKGIFPVMVCNFSKPIIATAIALHIQHTHPAYPVNA